MGIRECLGAVLREINKINNDILMKLVIRIPLPIMKKLILLEANEKYERFLSLQNIVFV